jgi:hypothetical protein
MARPPFKFDHCAFAEDYVCGRFTLARLAARHDMSRPLAAKVIRGERHPEVLDLIHEAIDARRRQTGRRLARLLERAVCTIARAMGGKASATALAAARIVLNRSLPEEPPLPPPRQVEPPGLWELSPELQKRVMEELGGPTEEAEIVDWALCQQGRYEEARIPWIQGEGFRQPAPRDAETGHSEAPPTCPG